MNGSIRFFVVAGALAGGLGWAYSTGALWNALLLATLSIALGGLYAISKNLMALTKQMAEIKESFELEMQLTRDRFSYVMGHDPDGTRTESLHDFVHGELESSESTKS